MKLSIVTTLYKSAQYIDEFYERITATALKVTNDFEIIFVDDGSPDTSLQKAKTIFDGDSRVKVIELSRNFGHHKAIMVGLKYCKGEHVFLIDSDLEESPEWLTRFYDQVLDLKVDAIIGIQSVREGNWVKRIGGDYFYKLFNLISTVKVPKGSTTARIMSRRFVDSLVKFRESELFFAGLCEITGYEQRTIEVIKKYKGKTSYSFTRRLKQSVDAITSFSNRPLYIIFIVGCTVFLFSSVYIVWIFYQKLFLSVQVGYASLIASIWAVGGLTLMCTGIIGVYLGKIFSEVKRRPTIIRKISERKCDNNN